MSCFSGPPPWDSHCNAVLGLEGPSCSLQRTAIYELKRTSLRLLNRAQVNCIPNCGSDGKESACYAGDPGWMPELGRSPGEGNGYPFLYSCLENSHGQRSLVATVHGITKSRTRLRDRHFHTNNCSVLSIHPLMFCVSCPDPGCRRGGCLRHQHVLS